jgi:hypothetical protein
MNETILTDLQNDVAARLAVAGYLSSIPVIPEWIGDISNRINVALAPLTKKEGKNGACVIVHPIEARIESVNASSILLKPRLRLRVLEHVLQNQGPNGTGKAALSIVLAVLNEMYQYRAAGLAGNFLPEDPPYEQVKDPTNALAYEVRLACQLSDPQVLVKVAAPVITLVSGSAPQLVTITCATEGSTIRYATNGAPPYEHQEGVQVYTGPFEIMEACMVRAGAVKAGCISSNTAYAKIS